MSKLVIYPVKSKGEPIEGKAVYFERYIRINIGDDQSSQIPTVIVDAEPLETQVKRAEEMLRNFIMKELCCE